MSETPTRPRQIEIIPPGGRAQPRAQVPALRPERQAAPPVPVPAWRKMLAHVPGVPTALGLWFFLADEQAPDGRRFAVMASIAYVLMPIEALLIFLRPLGLADDAAVLSGLLMFATSPQMEPYRQAGRAWLRGEAVAKQG